MATEPEPLDYDDIGPTVVNPALSPGPEPDEPPTLARGVLLAHDVNLKRAPSIAPVIAPRASGTQPIRRPPCVGDLLGGSWRLEEILGSGGSAYVYAATHTDGRRAAVKVLREELLHDAMMIERFLGDGRIANLVKHPGVVTALQDGVTDAGTPFLVVERLDGQTLEERIAEKGPLKLMEAAQMMKALLDVLAATHDKSIIHRDVKPENVFLTSSGRLKLIDFGIARPPLQMAATRTLEQTVIGTPAFMSPEQARGRWGEIDARSDLWAAGATFFRALTGRYLRTCTTAMEDLIEATEPLDSMDEVAPKLPKPLRAWLDKALAFDRKDRFATAKEMSEALNHVLWQKEVVPEPDDAATTRFVAPKGMIPGWAIAAIALVACLGLVVPAALLAPHGSRPSLQPTVTPAPPPATTTTTTVPASTTPASSTWTTVSTATAPPPPPTEAQERAPIASPSAR